LDGLRTVESQAGVQPVVTRAADGRLWFSTVRGVLVIDPDRFERRPVPPAVTVEEMVVNGRRHATGTPGTLPPGSNNVRFSYATAGLYAPARIGFRYKLEGLDRNWIDAGSRRDAFYANLPAGDFRFRVAACMPDGACIENAQPVAFS